MAGGGRMEELVGEYAGFLEAAGRLVEAAEGGVAGAAALGGEGGGLGGALGAAEAAWERLNVLSISLEGLLVRHRFRSSPPPPPPPTHTYTTFLRRLPTFFAPARSLAPSRAHPSCRRPNLQAHLRSGARLAARERWPDARAHPTPQENNRRLVAVQRLDEVKAVYSDLDVAGLRENLTAFSGQLRALR